MRVKLKRGGRHSLTHVRSWSTPVIESPEPNCRNGPEAEIQTETFGLCLPWQTGDGVDRKATYRLMPNPSSCCFALPWQQSDPCRARDVRLGISSKLRRNLARHIMDSTRRRPGGWSGWRPSILSLNFHSAPCIAVHRGAKFGGALPQPFVCLADKTRPMWLEFSVSVSEHCQRFGNCRGLAIPARRMDHCFTRLFQVSAHQTKRTSPRERYWTRHFVKSSTTSCPAYNE